MAIAVKDEYNSALPEQQKVRDLVMAGLEQIIEIIIDHKMSPSIPHLTVSFILI